MRIDISAFESWRENSILTHGYQMAPMHVGNIVHDEIVLGCSLLTVLHRDHFVEHRLFFLWGALHADGSDTAIMVGFVCVCISVWCDFCVCVYLCRYVYEYVFFWFGATFRLKTALLLLWCVFCIHVCVCIHVYAHIYVYVCHLRVDGSGTAIMVCLVYLCNSIYVCTYARM